MTISYSLDVAKARFGGFAKLLTRWKGSIYKILWREFLIFCLLYAFLSIMYRCWLNETQRNMFEKIVIFVATFTDLIPLSFVLGFYVSLVIGRWWSQYETIPWPDRVCFKVATYVHGSDERSRMIRRTLARYVILTKLLTFQMVSTAVKKRFPSTQHLVSAGLMTKEEWSIYENHEFSYGKWWLPSHWFCALAARAKKEGRIKDSILLDGLFQEILDFRTSCAIMIGYDWISVPLVYTQVVTIATYVYSAAMIIGRQYLNPEKGYHGQEVDLYVPLFTLLQFLFYVGWLKVAEQILNPYGEDDDDFELNWCIDRTVNLAYQAVDIIHMKHPKVCKDAFWGKVEIQLPQTKRSLSNMILPMGSAFYFRVDENVKYMPMDELLEQDKEENIYISNSMKKTMHRPSLIRRVLNSGLVQSIRRKPGRKANTTKSLSYPQGNINAAFEENAEIYTFSNNENSGPKSRNLSKKVSPTYSQKSNLSIRSLNNQKSFESEQKGNVYENNSIFASHNTDPENIAISENTEGPDGSTDSDVEHVELEAMPSIPEESSRSASIAKIDVQDVKSSNTSVKEEGIKVLKDFNNLNSAKEGVKNLNLEVFESFSRNQKDSKNENDNRKKEGEASMKSENAGEISVVIETDYKERK